MWTIYKGKESIQKLKKTRDSRYIYQNELDKACFQHDVAYGDFQNLTRITAFDKMLCGKAFNLAKNPKYDRYQRGLASMVYQFVDKISSGRAATLARSNTLATRATRKKSAIKNENISKKELAEELNKPIIRKFEKRKVHSSFIDNIWGADLTDMHLINLIKDARFYYLLLTFTVKMHGLFL